MSNSIENILRQIEKDFGVGTVVGAEQTNFKSDVISTGSLGLDIATGVGGFPRGCVVEILGWESSGKSTLTLGIIANAQKAGLRCLLVDGEDSFDKKYARNLGVDTEKLLVNQLDQDGAEKCYSVAERLIESGEIGVVVFDSQTSLIPKKAMQGDPGDSYMGLQARLMSSELPKIVQLAGHKNCLVIFINQIREKIGVMFGSPETTGAGGNALKFYAHMRVRTSKSVQKDGDVAYANKTTCKVIKNKVAAPFKEAEFFINFGEGIDRIREIVDIGSELGILDKAGAYYKYNGSTIGQGMDKAIQFLKDNPELKEEIEQRILDTIKPQTVETDSAA